MLTIKDKAPNFTLEDKDGVQVSLSDFLGKKVVLYFYPKDNTTGCTKQACEFKDKFSLFYKNNIVIIGVSKDTQKSHYNFSKKYELPFILLSDTDKKVLSKYGVLVQKNMYGKLVTATARTTFIIDEKGYIEKVFEKVKALENAEQVLQYFNIKG